MTQKTILITGCSSGLGYDAAHGLRDRGWRVFASCRQNHDCDRLREEGFESPLIDYAEPDTIYNGLAEVLEATGGTLDALLPDGQRVGDVMDVYALARLHGADLPTTFISYGTQDKQVSPESSRELVEVGLAAGVPIVVHRGEGEGHKAGRPGPDGFEGDWASLIRSVE